LWHTTITLKKSRFLRESASPAPVPICDEALARLADLRSGELHRVRTALATPFDPAFVSFAIRLLAWDQAAEWARAFLLRNAHRVVGQLVDSLLDSEEDVAVRRRLPYILAHTTSQRAVDGLTTALRDPHFEIRFNTGRALAFLHRMGEDLRFDQDVLLSAL